MVWVYGLFVEKLGDDVKKPMQDCTGEEITQEWLFHMGVPVEDIPELAITGAKAVPVMMPCVTASFMPRQAGDRPDVVPESAFNLAFIGQAAESKQRDCIFTTEYAVRTAREAVHTLLAASARLRDGKALDIPGPAFLRKLLLKELDRTRIGALLREVNLVGGD